MGKGLFIAFEGPDGSGKSTVAKRVKEYLENKDIQCVLTREPGGTPIGEKIREVVLDAENTEMADTTEALLYAASRAQHAAEKIAPLLKEGNVVLTDRYVFSSLAYQGYARGLGIDKIMELNEFGMNGVYPDKVLFFDVSPEIALARKFEQNEVNRIENEGESFHQTTYEGYHRSIKLYNQNVEMIDANGSIEETVENCIKAIDSLLKGMN